MKLMQCLARSQIRTHPAQLEIQDLALFQGRVNNDAVNLIKFAGATTPGVAALGSHSAAVKVATKFRPVSQKVIGSAVVFDYRIARARQGFLPSMLSATPQSLGLPPTPYLAVIRSCVSAP
jgi:hypothetical protein